MPSVSSRPEINGALEAANQGMGGQPGVDEGQGQGQQGQGQGQGQQGQGQGQQGQGQGQGQGMTQAGGSQSGVGTRGKTKEPMTRSEDIETQTG